MKNTLLIILALILTSCSSQEKELVEYSGLTMGTTYSIKILDNNYKHIKFDKLQSGIDSLLVSFNKKMSTYIEDSELSLFNKAKDTVWLNCSKELANVMNEANKISEYSNGAYDITVGPLVNLWGFGPENKYEKIPSEEEIKNRKLKIGFKNLEIDVIKSKIKKRIPELYCDLSSIAKGQGVDKVSEFLENKGIKDYMVEIGGEVRTLGKNLEGDNWRIGINVPKEGNEIEKVISISGKSVATSGDYRNYFEENGIRYSHTINPSTGKPINHKLASVTVIYDNCMLADGYATAFNVLGESEGLKLANRLKIPVFMIVRNGNAFVEIMNNEFKKYLKGE